MTLGQFFARRYGYTFLALLPIFAVIIFVATVVPRLNLTQENGDLLSIAPPLLLFFLGVYLMVTQRRLRGPLGWWQQCFKKIPSWNSYFASKVQNRS